MKMRSLNSSGLHKTEVWEEDGILAEFKSITLTLVLWGQSVTNNRKTVSTIGGRTFDKQHRDMARRKRNVPFLFRWKKRVKQEENIVCSVLRVFSVSQVWAEATQEARSVSGDHSGGDIRWWFIPGHYLWSFVTAPGPALTETFPHLWQIILIILFLSPRLGAVHQNFWFLWKDHHIIFKRTWHHAAVPMLRHQNWSRR